MAEEEDRPGVPGGEAEVPIGWEDAVVRVHTNRPTITNADEALLCACLPTNWADPLAKSRIRAFLQPYQGAGMGYSILRAEPWRRHGLYLLPSEIDVVFPPVAPILSPPGQSGRRSLAKDDAPIVSRILMKWTADPYLNLSAECFAEAERAAGSGTRESKAERLERRVRTARKIGEKEKREK